MSSPPLTYGFDLTTDIDDVVDPLANRVTAIGLATAAGNELYEGDEHEIIELVNRRLAMLPAGVIVSWNGATFDLPFLAVRARLIGIDLDLTLHGDQRSLLADSTLPGLDRPCLASWGHHQHLDLRQVYAKGERRRRSLRRRVDHESLIPETDELAQHDPSRTAGLGLRLASRRWTVARKSIDRLPRAVADPTDAVVAAARADRATT